MEPQQMVEMLSETELHDDAVTELVDRFTAMESHLERGEFTQVTEQVDEFCKAYVHLLNVELGEPLEEDTDFNAFIRKSRHDEIEPGEIMSIEESIPNMLSAAVGTLRQRAAGSSNLENAMDRADARVVSATSAWLIVELVRLYTEVDAFDETESMNSLINEQVEDTEGQQSLNLVRSRYEFDLNKLDQQLDGIVFIERETKDIVPGPEFPKRRYNQITALLLARMVIFKMGFCERPGVDPSWFDDRVGSSVGTSNLSSLDFVFKNSDEGGYYIPGFRVEEALEYLNPDS